MNWQWLDLLSIPLGIILLFLGLRWLNRKIQRTSGDTLFDRGVAHYNRDEFDQAICDFDDSLTRKPNYASTYRYRALAHYRKKNFQHALADLTKAITLKPNDAELHFWRGWVRVAAGQRAKGLADLHMAQRLGLKPDMQKAANAILAERVNQ